MSLRQPTRERQVYQLVLIFVGSGLGGLCRFGLTRWTQRIAPGDLPLGTLLVNVIGCVLIGILMGLFAERWPLRPEHRVALTVGVLGGFTTFSAFGWETFALLNNGQVAAALLNAVASSLLGVAGVAIGFYLVQ